MLREEAGTSYQHPLYQWTLNGCLDLQALSSSSKLTADSSESDNCTLTPERTEGPYYLQEELFRADITESQEGVPLLLRITVTDDDCNPLPNVFVDLWHCNSTGFYSGFTGEVA